MSGNYRTIILILAAMSIPFGVSCRSAPERGGAHSSQRKSLGVTARPQKAASPDNELVFLTYNVLADVEVTPARIEAMISVIRRSEADVVALQEVAPWCLQALRSSGMLDGSYIGSKIDGRVAAPGGQYILSKLPIERTDFRLLPGKQQRTVLLSHLRAGEQKLVVATTHMESYLEDGPVRAKQLDTIFGLIEGAENAVVLGDFNFGEGEPEGKQIPSSYVDLWKVLRSEAPGLTWNIEKSPMAKRGSFPGEKSRRIDRILLRSKRWEPAEVRIVGDTPYSSDGQLYPSDHFGVVGTLRRRR